MSTLNKYAEILFLDDSVQAHCLGLKLQTLTFGHLFFMEHIGSNYSIIGTARCTPMDLAGAVFICHFTADELLEMYEKKEDVSPLLEAWATEFVKQKIGTLSAEDLAAIANSNEDYYTIMSKLVTPEDHKHFQDYLAFHNKTPMFRISPERVNDHGPRSYIGDLDNLFDFVKCQHPSWTDEQLFAYPIKRARLDRLHYMSKEGIGVFVHPFIAEQPPAKIYVKEQK